MSETKGLTDDGYNPRSPREFFDVMREEYERRTGERLDVSRSNVIVDILVIVASILGEMQESLGMIYDSWDINQASGLQLDSRAALVGITRKPPQPARVQEQQFRGELGTVIPEGKEVEGGGPDGRLRWTVQEDVRLGWSYRIPNLAGSATTLADGTYELRLEIPTASVNEVVDYDVGPDDDLSDLLRGLRDAIRRNRDLSRFLEATTGDDSTIRRGDNVLVVQGKRSIDFTLSIVQDPDGNATVEDGFALGPIEAQEPGDVGAETGEVTKIVTPVQGWNETDNPRESFGQDRESDPALRLRTPESLPIRGTATKPAIRANLRDLDFLRAAEVIDNPTNQTQTVQGFELAPHTVGIVVWPGNLLESQRKEVAATLHEHVAMGIGTGKDVATFGSGDTYEATVESPDGTEKTYPFHTASQQGVAVDIDVELADDADPSEVLPDLERQISEYLKTRQVGQPARRLHLYGIADDIGEVANVDRLELDGQPSDVPSDITTKLTDGGVSAVLV
jgi:hypothetical protein